MNNEDNNKTEQEGKETTEDTKESISIVDEARKIRDEIKAEREKLDKANKESRELAATRIMSGDTTSEAAPVKEEETPKEYRDRIDKEIMEGKHED